MRLNHFLGIYRWTLDRYMWRQLFIVYIFKITAHQLPISLRRVLHIVTNNSIFNNFTLKIQGFAKMEEQFLQTKTGFEMISERIITLKKLFVFYCEE